MLTDSRDTTVLLASRASDLGSTEFLAHFQVRAARRTPFCPVPPSLRDFGVVSCVFVSCAARPYCWPAGIPIESDILTLVGLPQIQFKFVLYTSNS